MSRPPLRRSLRTPGTKPSGPTQTFLFDDYPGAIIGWAFRRLWSGYTGPLVRIINNTNTNELDIGYDSDGDLDEAAIDSHCSGTTCDLITIYGQNDKGTQFDCESSGNDCLIYTAGSVPQLGGRPVINFTGSEEYMQNSGVMEFHTAFTCCFTGSRTSSGGRRIFTTGVLPSSADIQWTMTNAAVNFNIQGQQIQSSHNMTQEAHSAFVDLSLAAASKVRPYRNGVSQATSGSIAASALMMTDGISLGGAFGAGQWIGGFQEMLVWDVDQIANQAAIDNERLLYYAI